MMNPLNTAKFYILENLRFDEKRSSSYLLSASQYRDELNTNTIDNSTSSSSSSKLSLMDFFDVRKFQSHRDFVFHDGRMQAVSDYSLIALLPVILVAALITGIFLVYRFRKWKHNRKQIAQLTEFYNIVESSPCLSAKHHLVQHCKKAEKSECDLISRAVTVPTPGSSLFFQPIPPKLTKSIKCSGNGNIVKAADASEIIYHFSQLPPPEKLLKRPGAIVHRV